MDRFASERKEMSEQMQEIESQLEWLRSEQDDEIAKLTSEKKILQDRLHRPVAVDFTAGTIANGTTPAGPLA